MLIEFAVENFRSIKELTRLNMEATKIRGLPSHKIRVSKKVSTTAVSLNKLAILFGANASGKSNFLKAIVRMKEMVEVLGENKHSKRNKSRPQFYTPYAFTKEAQAEPTLFQASYIVNNQYYRYGFTYDATKICEEWLYSGQLGNETLVFERTSNNTVDFGETVSKETQSLLNDLEDSKLLLSLGAKNNHHIFSEAVSFFSDIRSIDYSSFQERYWKIADDLEDREELLLVLSSLLAFADTGITTIERRVPKKEWLDSTDDIPDELPDLSGENEDTKKVITKLFEYAKALNEYAKTLKEAKRTITETIGIAPPKELWFKHNAPSDSTSNSIFFQMIEESRGTIVYLGFLIDFIYAFEDDALLIIDEFENSLHPQLVAQLLQIFTTFKKCNAQLITTSHSPFIFSTKVVRRDELWLMEKNIHGCTSLTNAAEYQISKKGDLTHRYLMGRYGGIPLFDFDKLPESKEQYLKSSLLASDTQEQNQS